MPTAKDVQSLQDALKLTSDDFRARVAAAVNRILRPAEQERTAQVKKELDSLYD